MFVKTNSRTHQHRSNKIAALLAGVAFAYLLPQAGWAQTTAAEVSHGPVSAIGGATIRQQQWLAATVEQRVALAEQIGEEGARALAKSRGWMPLMDGTNSVLRQGLDQVYRDVDGIIHVVEAKGGGSPLGRAYGYVQGTPEWAVKAAERTIKSPVASAIEKEASKSVLKAACNGNLKVHVVRTNHVLGEPTAATLEETVRAADGAAALARPALDALTQDAVAAVEQESKVGGKLPDSLRKAMAESASEANSAARYGGKAAPETADAVATLSKVGPVVSKAALPIAAAIELDLRVSKGTEIEHQFATGELSQEQREVEHAKNVAGAAGGWAGAWAGAELGAIVGGSGGTCITPGPGTAVGAAVGTIAGGIGGYIGGEAAAEAAAEWAVNQLHIAGTTIADTADTVCDTVSATAKKWANATSETASSAWSGTKSALNSTGETCRNAGNWTVARASSAWNWVRGR